MRTVRSLALTGVSLAMLTQPLQAQEIPSSENQGAVAPDESAAVATSDPIVVTGSRIVRRDYTAESPITTIGEEFIQKTLKVA